MEIVRYLAENTVRNKVRSWKAMRVVIVGSVIQWNPINDPSRRYGRQYKQNCTAVTMIMMIEDIFWYNKDSSCSSFCLIQQILQQQKWRRSCCSDFYGNKLNHIRIFDSSFLKNMHAIIYLRRWVNFCCSLKIEYLCLNVPLQRRPTCTVQHYKIICLHFNEI